MQVCAKMKISDAYFQADLKATLERSLDLKAVLEHMCLDPNPVYQVKAVSRLNVMQKKVRKAKESLGFKDPSLPESSLKKHTTVSPHRQTSPVTPLGRRHEGKKKLFKSLRDGNLRILATRAGRQIEGAANPSDLRAFRTFDQSDLSNETRHIALPTKAHLHRMPTSVVQAAVETNASEFLITQQRFEPALEPIIPKLPFVSLANGRTEELCILPTFDEYAMRSTVQGLNSPESKAFEAIKRTHEHFTAFKKKIDNIETIFKNRSLGGNRDRRARHMSVLPGSSGYSAARQVRTINSFQAAPHPTKQTMATAHGPTSHQVTNYVSTPSGFSTQRTRNSRLGDAKEFDAVECQETKLSQIVDSMLGERPTSMRRKQRLFSADIDQPGMLGSTTRGLNEVRQVAEQERWDKHRLNLKQGHMYRQLLDKIMTRKRPQNPAELNVIEIVRMLLESGEVVGQGTIEHITRVVGSKGTEVEGVLRLLKLFVEVSA
jgi:hypothetical protein